ncbi:hypothetical protein GY45DRAFT_565510 [Cubamyces sp. BRFM 1775]|nr:hypothetical protein GY45DRAFT_565510 [Cubamyces sp. BRFM 1775]
MVYCAAQGLPRRSRWDTRNGWASASERTSHTLALASSRNTGIRRDNHRNTRWRSAACLLDVTLACFCMNCRRRDLAPTSRSVRVNRIEVERLRLKNTLCLVLG